MKPKASLALLLSLCIFSPVLAQTLPPPPPPPKMRNAKSDEVVKITTNLVQVDAVQWIDFEVFKETIKGKSNKEPGGEK